MALTAPASDKKRDPVPAGNHIARLYQIIHLGTIKTGFKDEDGDDQTADTVRLSFELCNELKVFKEGDDPKPLAVAREFTFYMSPKSNLRKFVEGFIGTTLADAEASAFDLEQLLGQPCLLNVVHKTSKSGNVYALVSAAAPLPKGMTAPALVNSKSVIDVASSPIEEIDALPDFLKDKMKSSNEYDLRFRSADDEAPTSNIGPDDIPF
jgi:hypothetical protein